MTNSKMTIFEAVSKVGQALSGLSESEQHQVIRAVAELVGMPETEFTPKQTSRASGNANTTSVGEAEGPISGKSASKKLSLAEFLDNCKPANNSQRIAAIAAYRQLVEGKELFARLDLKPYFSKARLPEPKNFDRDFNKTVKDGHIYEDGEKSYLTQKGEEAVDNGFDGKQAPRGRAVKKAGKGK
ncbi:MAG: hypothetical protein R3B67_00645 [Phycisphaerales bacterium]